MISGRNIAIFGFGKEGQASANYLGKSNQITIIDEKDKDDIDNNFFKNLRIKNAHFSFGHQIPQNLRFDYVVRSPGVRPDNFKINSLVKSGAILTSATKIFFDACPCQIIGVTGTKGKGTTASLIHQILKSQSSNVYLAGNIGTPALEILPELTRDSTVVLELSSFQLLDLKKSPH